MYSEQPPLPDLRGGQDQKKQRRRRLRYTYYTRVGGARVHTRVRRQVPVRPCIL